MKKNDSKSSQRYFLVIVIAAIFFALSGFVFSSSLNNIPSLSSELISSPRTIYNYNIAELPPFKYRILFSSLIKSTYNIFSEPQNSENFYIVYILWSGLSYIAAALSFYFLLNTLNFNNLYSFSGVMLFLISPAVLSAYTLPVHTREDFLAYTILNFSLIFIIKRNFIGVLILSVLGVLCRETLLIIPFLYVLVVKNNMEKKILISFVCFITFVGLRILLGHSSYDPLGLGLLYNIKNIEESVGFIFLVFGFMWPIFLFDIYFSFKNAKKLPDDDLRVLRKTALPIFLLIFVTTLVGGRINEMRLLFLSFPWVISIFLYYLNTFSFEIWNVIRSLKFRIIIVIIGSLIIPIYYIAKTNIYLFVDGVFTVPYHHWIAITCFQLFLFFSSLPIYFRILRSSSHQPLRSLITTNQ